MLIRLLSVSIAVSTLGFSAVSSISISERSDVLGGRAFGAVGAYERLKGTVRFEVDPAAAANRGIVDVGLAPRNASGRVEFSADLYILKPKNLERSNGTILFEVSNRGGKGILGLFNRAAGSADPRAEREFGDLLLLEQGYTLVWVGWQFDVPPGENVLRIEVPIASLDGKPITGPVRSEFLTDKRVSEFNLGDRTMIPYKANPADFTARLTVRDQCASPRRVVPRANWNFKPDGSGVTMASGFEAGKIYEMVYQGSNPPVAGLGFAAVRDLISYMKHGGAGEGDPIGAERRFLRRAIGYGTSQSGRFLRSMLYEGFNADEQGRIVFDGVWSHVGGGGRISVNVRFAQPSRDGHPLRNCLYPVDLYPYTDVAQRDAESGLNLGLMDRAIAAKVAPKTFYTNGSYEYWGRAAGLTHISVDGKADVAPLANSRLYYLAGTQHGAGSFPARPNENTQFLQNGNDYRWHMRALLAAMNQWVTSGVEPPASRYPRIDKDQLVSLGALHWPAIPGVKLPQSPLQGWHADYGPEFRTKGIVSQEPPKLGSAFPTLLPQMDADGNDVSGVRAPMLQAPLATFTGWNMRKAEVGAPAEMYPMIGSTFVLAKTREERVASGDPRPSVAERYQGKADYLSRYEAAAKALVSEGFLLERDLPALMAAGSAQWDAVMR